MSPASAHQQRQDNSSAPNHKALPGLSLWESFWRSTLVQSIDSDVRMQMHINMQSWKVRKRHHCDKRSRLAPWLIPSCWSFSIASNSSCSSVHWVTSWLSGCVPGCSLQQQELNSLAHTVIFLWPTACPWSIINHTVSSHTRKNEAELECSIVASRFRAILNLSSILLRLCGY